MVYLVSDKSTDYTKFLAETIEEFTKHNIKGIAIVGITDSNYELTGYWNMKLRDKLQAENAVRFDAFDDFLKSNSGRYCNDDGDDPTP